MKKILLSSLLCMMFSAPAFAQSGYLTDSSGSVIKSGFGLCWNTSATKVPNIDCGDVIEPPKKAEAIVKPQVLPGLVPTQQVTQQKLVVNASVLFKFDSAQLSAQGEEVLNQQVVAVNPESVEIVGHTDQLGTQKYNLKLSQKRAESVKAFLTSKGIAENKITTTGMGESQLLCEEKHPKKSSECSTKNRRVEITTQYVK